MNFAKIISAAFLFLISFTGFAQLTVVQTGRVDAGTQWTANQDNSNILTMCLLGRNNTNYRPGSKLSFGDFGSPANYGANAWIGEYTFDDTDALELGGKNGIYFKTGGTMTYEAAKITTTGDLYLRGSVTTSYPYFYSSDIRLKTNIVPLTNSMALISKIKAIRYDYKMDDDKNYLASLTATAGKALEPKSVTDLAKFKKDLQTKIDNGKNQIGFSAQDLQTVLPELVKTDEKGMLSVNYTGLIPVLVEALNEQQKTISDQAAAIQSLQNDIAAIKKKLGM